MPDLMFPQTGTVSERARGVSLAIFLLIIAVGVAYVAVHLVIDLEPVQQSSAFPYVLLGFALLIALGFEFVNGFHDTANAVATVIYTHSLTPNLTVLWSGAWNFAGVLVSSGAVAFGIIQLLPVEMILQVGGHAGFAMVFALLAFSNDLLSIETLEVQNTSEYEHIAENPRSFDFLPRTGPSGRPKNIGALQVPAQQRRPLARIDQCETGRLLLRTAFCKRGH